MVLNLELNILTGCDGVGKSEVYNKIFDKEFNRKYDEYDDNLVFERFPTEDTRYLISLIGDDHRPSDLIRHKMFEADFHLFLQEINHLYDMQSTVFDFNKPIKVVMDRFFPCNMAYGLYHLGDHPWVLPTLDFLGNFINKKDNPNRTIDINILHISPNIEEWVKYNGESMNTSFLFTIEENYQKVYNYLQENYSSSDLEGRKGITSLKISKFCNNYDGNLEKQIREAIKIPNV